jgi:glutamate 5-kinase
MLKPEEGPIPLVTNVDEIIHHAQEDKTKLGTGGMISKLRAVQEAVLGGVECLIASGRHAEQIPELVEGRGVGTRFPVTAN